MNTIEKKPMPKACNTPIDQLPEDEKAIGDICPPVFAIKHPDHGWMTFRWFGSWHAETADIQCSKTTRSWAEYFFTNYHDNSITPLPDASEISTAIKKKLEMAA